MKNYKKYKKTVRFYFLLAIAIGIILVVLLSHKSPSVNLIQSSNKITNVGGANVYKLNVDGQQYIIVINGPAVAITKHN